MWIRRLEDLRFVIGIFFGIIAGILIGTGLFRGDTSASLTLGLNLNLITGISMGSFSALMLWISENSPIEK